MLQHDRNEVAKRLRWGIRENQLASRPFFLSTIRNRCAHDERLYSYSSYTYLCGNNYFNYFRIINNTIFNELSSKLTTIPISKIRSIMGFPNNWKRLKTLRWFQNSLDKMTLIPCT